MNPSSRPFMNRRRFLTVAPGAAGAVWLGGRFAATPSLEAAGAAPAPAALAPSLLRAEAEQMPPHPTLATSYGPFYRANAPARAKVSPPLAPGTTLVQSGRIWGLDSRRPLAGARMEVWQVDHEGKYSDGVADRSYRATLVAGDEGIYEFETIHPVAYQANADFWRSPHIHFQVAHPGYRTLVSEFFFVGDPRQDKDHLFRRELLVPLKREGTKERGWESGRFDIVLEPA